MTNAVDSPVSAAIATAGPQDLAVRSAALVRRGLRDLARDSNWVVKKLFSGGSPRLAVSPAGQVCAFPLERGGGRHAVLYDLERNLPPALLPGPGMARPASAEADPAACAWSPDGTFLAVAWSPWAPVLHGFDLQGKLSVRAVAEFQKFPECVAWSERGKYFAMTSPAAAQTDASAKNGGSHEREAAALRLWNSSPAGLVSPAPIAELGAPSQLESQALGDFGEAGRFRGYGQVAFSPDERLLAAAAQIQGEWADDFLLISELPSLERQNLFQAAGQITSVTWSADSRQIIYCAAGQAYRISAATRRSESLPFGAELAACHPYLPLCLYFSSWLKNSAKGSLFVVDLRRDAVVDECAAEGVRDLRWSASAAKAYAVAENGLAYIYEPAVL